jgi:RNA polymerase sigma-70 factor (ECF subfamily)
MSSCAIQSSESGVPFSQPRCLSGSRKSIRNIIVRAETCADADGLSTFLSERAHLFGIAYRMLKSTAEAEDIVQDVWIRWQTTDRSAVRDAAAFLATTTRRLAINVIQSARSRRETFVGSSPRESVDACPDPELEVARSEALRSAVLVLLEKLSPAERAVYVLREAFDYSYREIANILRLGEANTRQLVTRARQHVADGQHTAVNSVEQRRFFAAFFAAAQNGALRKLESFLAGSVNGTAGNDERTVRTRSNVGEPIAVPRHRWPLLPQLDAKVA